MDTIMNFLIQIFGETRAFLLVVSIIAVMIGMFITLPFFEFIQWILNKWHNKI